MYDDAHLLRCAEAAGFTVPMSLVAARAATWRRLLGSGGIAMPTTIEIGHNNKIALFGNIVSELTRTPVSAGNEAENIITPEDAFLTLANVVELHVADGHLLALADIVGAQLAPRSVWTTAHFHLI